MTKDKTINFYLFVNGEGAHTFHVTTHKYIHNSYHIAERDTLTLVFALGSDWEERDEIWQL